MDFSAAVLLERIGVLVATAGPASRYLVAYSGGMDSTVLLHALCASAANHGRPVVAIHVDHGLHAESASWAGHCRDTALAFGADFLLQRVEVDLDGGAGPEAAAREARYAALSAFVEPGDWLMSAHHEDDQAETLLINLLRGSGLAGLAGIGACQPFAAGFLLRPLLGVSRDRLERYARAHRLAWIDDPSNADVLMDRNYLRHEVLPRLVARWPAAASGLRRSAELAAEANSLLADLGEVDLRAAGEPGRLKLEALGRLSAARQRNLLRQAVRRCKLPPVPARRLQQVVGELLPARDDAQPLVRWAGAEMRRYRGVLYLLPERTVPPPELPGQLRPDAPLELGHGLGMLRIEAGREPGIQPALARAGLAVRFRDGGEAMRLPGERHRRKLKKLLQDKGVLPWMRTCIPLLYAGDRLIAVGDLWIAAEAYCEDGYPLRWDERPLLF